MLRPMAIREYSSHPAAIETSRVQKQRATARRPEITPGRPASCETVYKTGSAPPPAVQKDREHTECFDRADLREQSEDEATARRTRMRIRRGTAESARRPAGKNWRRFGPALFARLRWRRRSSQSEKCRRPWRSARGSGWNSEREDLRARRSTQRRVPAVERGQRCQARGQERAHFPLAVGGCPGPAVLACRVACDTPPSAR